MLSYGDVYTQQHHEVRGRLLEVISWSKRSVMLRDAKVHCRLSVDAVTNKFNSDNKITFCCTLLSRIMKIKIQGYRKKWTGFETAIT